MQQQHGDDDGDGTPLTSSAGRPWVERYRPKTLSQVSHQNEVVSTLQNAVETGRLPHLLFYGPPGSGKTSVALALCRQLWEPSQWRKRVLELNASDERGISVVRDKIKHFASLTVGTTTTSKKKKKLKMQNLFGVSTAAKQGADEEEERENQAPQQPAYPNPPYKIIILDEADQVTPDAQAALRRIIEAYSKITRFILICNYVTRIIEPLASRCAKFRFQALPPESMKGRLSDICRMEGFHIAPDDDKDDAVLDEILNVSNGDMRRAVTTLQSVHSLGAAAFEGGKKKKNAIAELAGLPPPSVVQTLWESFAKGSFETMREAVDHVLLEGYSAQLLLQAMLPYLMTSEKDDSSVQPKLTEMEKANLAMKLAQAEHAMVQGADESLQLLTVGSVAVQCFAKSKRELQKAQQ